MIFRYHGSADHREGAGDPQAAVVRLALRACYFRLAVLEVLAVQRSAHWWLPVAAEPQEKPSVVLAAQFAPVLRSMCSTALAVASRRSRLLAEGVKLAVVALQVAAAQQAETPAVVSRGSLLGAAVAIGQV